MIFLLASALVELTFVVWAVVTPAPHQDCIKKDTQGKCTWEEVKK